MASNLSPEQLAQILAQMQGQPTAYGGAGGQTDARNWYTPGTPSTDQYSRTLIPGQREQGTGDAQTWVADSSRDQDYLLRGVPDSAGKLNDVWDARTGEYLGQHEAQDGGGRHLNQAVALIAGGTFGGQAAFGNAAGSTTGAAASGSGMANGAFLGEGVASGIGGWDAAAIRSALASGQLSTAASYVGQNLANGTTLDTLRNLTSNPTGTPGSTPGTNTSTPGTRGGTVRNWAEVLQSGLRVADSTSGGGGGGGGGLDGEPDQRLVDAQLRSMDLQDQMLQRMISNADMIMPFQREALDFSLQTAREAYGDYRADRGYALERRGQLTRLQDQAIADARNFNTEDKRRELAGHAVADVNRAFGSAIDTAGRSVTRSGRSLSDGRWGSVLRQLVADKTLAQAAAGTAADRGAREEGRMLTDRAAGMLTGAPAQASNATAGGQGAGASTVPLAGQSLQAMNSGLTSAAAVAGQLGSNATSMFGQQLRTGNNNRSTDWSAAGALLGGLTKAYDIWGS